MRFEYLTKAFSYFKYFILTFIYWYLILRDLAELGIFYQYWLDGLLSLIIFSPDP